jgi:hypothetical protein
MYRTWADNVKTHYDIPYTRQQGEMSGSEEGGVLYSCTEFVNKIGRGVRHRNKFRMGVPEAKRRSNTLKILLANASFVKGSHRTNMSWRYSESGLKKGGGRMN